METDVMAVHWKMFYFNIIDEDNQREIQKWAKCFASFVSDGED